MHLNVLMHHAGYTESYTQRIVVSQGVACLSYSVARVNLESRFNLASTSSQAKIFFLFSQKDNNQQAHLGAA